MEDYPRNINELEARFGAEEACHEYLFRLRWPEDFGALVAEGAKRGHFDRCVCNAAVVDIRPQ